MTKPDYLNDPILAGLSEIDHNLIREVHDLTEVYFRDPKFDSSHDFNHVTRVLGNAMTILRQEAKMRTDSGLPEFDVKLIVLGALMHDIGDRKYVDSVDAPVRPVQQKLVELGVSSEAALVVQELVDGVSYSSEIKAPEHVQSLIQRIPELAVVQDADRLDAIGAIGIGRCFTFGGARGGRTLGDSVQHFEDKLLKLESMMKTETGRSLAAKRSTRIRDFMEWWSDETAAGEYA